MAFDANSFGFAVNPCGPRVHAYNTADAIADVNTAGYFNDAKGMVKVNDIIIITDTNTAKTYIAYVASNASGVVDITDGIEFASMSTDSD